MVYTILFRVSTIQAAGFLPSTVYLRNIDQCVKWDLFDELLSFRGKLAVFHVLFDYVIILDNYICHPQKLRCRQTWQAIDTENLEPDKNC